MKSDITFQRQTMLMVISLVKLKRQPVMFHFGGYLNKQVIAGIVYLLIGNNKGGAFFGKNLDCTLKKLQLHTIYNLLFCYIYNC